MQLARSLALVGVAACSSGRRAPSDEVAAVRLSTHIGLAPMTPATRGTMTRHLQEMAFSPASSELNLHHVSGREAHFMRRPESQVPLARLAAAFRHEDLVGIHVEGDVLVAELEATAEAALEHYFLDLGPYEQESYSSERLILKRRSGSGPRRIEVHNFATEEEEWRRLLGREVDLVPVASPSHLGYLKAIPSIRIYQVQRPLMTAIWFRLKSPQLGDLRVRQAISLALRRAPLAQVVNGDSTGAAQMPEDLERARAIIREIGLAPKLTLLVEAPATDLQRAALVIEQQLATIGITVELKAVGLEEFFQRRIDGDFEALLFYGGFEPRYWRFFLSTEATPINYCGYANAEFDSAVAANENAKAKSILERDLPATPLYFVNEGVAMERTLCGARPQTSSDLTWLSQVHRCAPGEEN